MYHTDLLVVGAGIADVRTVQALRMRGFAGTVTLVGGEPHEPYDRPPLSKQYLCGQETPRPLGAEWGLLRACCMLGRYAISLDVNSHTVILDDGTVVSFGILVIATGASARRLHGLPEGVHVLRTLDDANRLRSALGPATRLAVIGARFIGLRGGRVRAQPRYSGNGRGQVPHSPSPASSARPSEL